MGLGSYHIILMRKIFDPFWSKLSYATASELKNKGKVQLDNLKSDRSRSRELFIKKFKSQFKWGFAKVVVTTCRAGRVREWSQGVAAFRDAGRDR